MGRSLPPRRPHKSPKPAGRPGSQSRKKRAQPSRSLPLVPILVGLLAVVLMGLGGWWLSQRDLAALLRPADQVVTLSDGTSLTISGESPLAGLSPDELRGAHHGERVVPVTRATYDHPLQRRSTDPWIELSNPRVVPGAGGEELHVEFRCVEGDATSTSIGLMIDQGDVFGAKPLSIAGIGRRELDVTKMSDSKYIEQLRLDDFRLQLQHGTRRGTARLPLPQHPRGPGGQSDPRKWELFVAASTPGYAVACTYESASSKGRHSGSIHFKVSNSVTINGATVTEPREWLPEELAVICGPPSDLPHEMHVTLASEPPKQPTATPHSAPVTAVTPSEPAPSAVPPAAGSMQSGFAGEFSNFGPIDNLDGWQVASLADGRLKVLAPPGTGDSKITEQVDFGGYDADVVGAKYRDERGLLMYASWAAFPRGVPKLVRAAAGQGDFERLIAIQAAAMFGKNPFRLSTISDTRGMVHKFPSRRIEISARPYTGGETVRLEIVWILGRDFAATFSFAYPEPRPSVLDQVIDSIEIEGNEIHELDREQFPIADRRGVDVLAAIDVKRQQIFGPWSRDGNAIVGGSDTADALLYLPVRSPNDYRLSVDVERVSGDGPLHFGIWLGDEPATVVIDEAPGTMVGLALVNEKPLLQPTPRPTLVNRKVTIRVVVRGDTITATADGRKLFQWQNGLSTLSLDHQLWNLPEYLLFLGTQGAQFRFRRIELEALE